MKFLQTVSERLLDKEMRTTALKVAVIVGSLLFVINHGWVLAKGQMTRERWFSAGLTYIVPYCVSIHGQCTRRKREPLLTEIEGIHREKPKIT